MDHHLTRDQFFAANRAQLRSHYLAEPGNPYRQSGRSSGAARWEETRRLISDAVDGSGSFLDVGCANGLLLETLREWLRERSVTISPFGVDFIAELIELARIRVTDGTFWTANAWNWEPPQRFDYVRTNLEYVLPADREEFVDRQAGWVRPGGRLILCHYRDRGVQLIDVAEWLGARSYEVLGAATADGVSVAWVEI